MRHFSTNNRTSTFPSLYVSVVGGVSVSNYCGLVGSAHTNPPPVAVPAITTASYKTWPSTCRPQGEDAEAHIDTLALSDLACPTWGLSNPFSTSCDGSTYLTATYGEPYNPVILVPTEILSIDPAWGSCTSNSADALLTLPCGIYDPPKALQTAHALVAGGDPGDPGDPASTSVANSPDALKQANVIAPSVTPMNDPPAPTTAIAAPANVGSPSLPKPTTVPSSSGTDPSKDSGQGASDPSGASDPTADLKQLDPLAPSNKQSEDPNQSSSVQEVDPSPSSNSQTSDPNNPVSNASGAVANSDPNNAGSDTAKDPGQKASDQVGTPAPNSGSQGSGSNVQPAIPQAPTTINLGGGMQSTQGLGAIINGALGASSAPSPAPTPAFTPHVVTALGQTLSITDPSAVAIAGSTLSVGGPAHTSDGKYYSLASSGNLVAGTLPSSPAPSSPLVLSVAGSTYTANAASQFVVAGQTLTPGGQIAVSGTKVSLAPAANAAVIGTSTQVLATPAPASSPAVLTFGGSTYTANTASQFVIAGQTLAPGGQIAVSGTTLSLAPSANVAVIGTSTQSLTTSAPSANAAVLTFAGSTYTANSATQFIVAGQTLTPGGTITASSTVISMPQGTNFAVIGSSTQFLGTASAKPSTAEAPVLTLGGSTYTADASSDFVIASQTLTPGGIITVLGTPISLAPGAADAVVGSSTQMLSSAVITPADIVTVAGQTITANPTGFAIDGTSILPGGTGAMISGTPVSMNSGGTLVMGNSSVVLPTGAPTTGPAVFEGGQKKLALPGMGNLVVYTIFCTLLGALFFVR